MTACRCKFCVEPVQFWRVPEDELLDLAGSTDARHQYMRVFAFIELFYRRGIFHPSMPFVVWRQVMGPGIPFPTNGGGMGAFSLHGRAAYDSRVH